MPSSFRYFDPHGLSGGLLTVNGGLNLSLNGVVPQSHEISGLVLYAEERNIEELCAVFGEQIIDITLYGPHRMGLTHLPGHFLVAEPFYEPYGVVISDLFESYDASNDLDIILSVFSSYSIPHRSAMIVCSY